MENQKMIVVSLQRKILYIGDVIAHDIGYSVVEDKDQIEWAEDRDKEAQQLILPSDEEIKRGWCVVNCSELEIVNEINRVESVKDDIVYFDKRSKIHKDYCTQIIAAYPSIGVLPKFEKEFFAEWCKNPDNYISVKNESNCGLICINAKNELQCFIVKDEAQPTPNSDCEKLAETQAKSTTDCKTEIQKRAAEIRIKKKKLEDVKINMEIKNKQIRLAKIVTEFEAGFESELPLLKEAGITYSPHYTDDDLNSFIRFEKDNRILDMDFNNRNSYRYEHPENREHFTKTYGEWSKDDFILWIDENLLSVPSKKEESNEIMHIDDDHTTTPILTEKEKGYIISSLKNQVFRINKELENGNPNDAETQRNFSELAESYEHLIDKVQSLGNDGIQFSDSPACKISLNLLLKAQKSMEQLIELTPSGDQRNILCDENIELLSFIKKLEDTQ